MRLVAAACAGIAAATLLGACESSQDKNRRLAAASKDLVKVKKIDVGPQNPDVSIVSSDVLEDENGTAAVVTMRNTSKRALAGLPIAIDVRDGSRQSVFKNDTEGVEPSLISAPYLGPGDRFSWVNDQVNAPGARRIEATVGKERSTMQGRVPEIRVGPARLEQDPVSGILAEGRVSNRSKVAQSQLTIHAVARRGSRVVAAGRGQIEELKAGRRAKYTIFFIGNPRGAELSLFAPPTTFK